VRLEGLGKLKKFIRLTWFRTHDLPACSIVPRALRYRVHPVAIRQQELKNAKFFNAVVKNGFQLVVVMLDVCDFKIFSTKTGGM
jgi:hypothetical protein